MIFKKNIISKILSNGLKVDVSLVQIENAYQAALYIDGRFIPGPPHPTPLVTPKGDVTHWMGNHPSVGLTAQETEKICAEVKLENSVLTHRKYS